MGVPVDELAVVTVDLGECGEVIAALERAGARVVSDADAATVREARSIALVGEGSFYDGADYLRDHGLDAAVLHAVAHGAPCLGVGLGMCLLYARGAGDVSAGAPVARPMRPTPSGVGLTCGTVFEYKGSLFTRGLGLLGREDDLPATVTLADEGLFGIRDVAALKDDGAAVQVLGMFIAAARDAI